MLTRAYDTDGNSRPLFDLDVGDIIEWKRNGFAGFRRARVTAILERDGQGERSRPIKIKTLTYLNTPSGERDRWIGRAAVMRIYDQLGVRKSPTQSA